MKSIGARLVLITGVTRGLGLALVEKFVELKHCTIGCGRNEAAIKQLQTRFPKPHSFTALDVTSDGDVKKWAEQIIAHHGAPDLLINNAALINAPAPLWKVPPAEFSAVIDVNIKGVANVIRHFVPAMIEKQNCVIVNLSSGWGRSVSPDVAPYCATKWAIEGLTKALAEDLPPGMAAIPLSPGIINTDMLKICFGKDAESYPDARQWANTAAPFLLKLGAKDNGKSLTTP